MYQYRVEFDPPVESKRSRIALAKQHSDSLFMGKDAFDGQELFSLVKLANEVIVFLVSVFIEVFPNLNEDYFNFNT